MTVGLGITHCFHHCCQQSRYFAHKVMHEVEGTVQLKQGFFLLNCQFQMIWQYIFIMFKNYSHANNAASC